MSTETNQMNNVPPMERVGSILAIESASPLQYLENCSLCPWCRSFPHPSNHRYLLA